MTEPPVDSQDKIKEKCAVIGLYNVGNEASRLAFYGLWALQHRGQESSGIVSSDGAQLYRHTAPGLVSNVYHDEDIEQLVGHIAIGHNRYSTSGGTDSRYFQPFLKRNSKVAFAHNGNLPQTDKLRKFLKDRQVKYEGLSDSGLMAEAIDCFVSDGLDIAQAVSKAYPLFTGVFSAVAMSIDSLVAFRDPCGIRPLALGRIGNGYVVASETCAFDTIGATFIREIKPGEMIVINSTGLSSYQLAKGTQKLDIFEFVYFARPDSLIMGKRVNEVRRQMGKQLAVEFKIKADVVIPVPDSAIPAALGYAESSGIPFDMGLIKNRYIHRTFIRPTPELRERDLKMKLNPVIESIKNKSVIIVDDSIVRGTTTKKLVGMIKDAGASEVHVLISSPPVKYPDFYGINTPSQADLIASHMSIEEIKNHIGATSLGYLSYDGMIKATGLPADMFSTSCFDGVYPIDIGQKQYASLDA